MKRMLWNRRALLSLLVLLAAIAGMFAILGSDDATVKETSLDPSGTSGIESTELHPNSESGGGISLEEGSVPQAVPG